MYKWVLKIIHSNNPYFRAINVSLGQSIELSLIAFVCSLKNNSWEAKLEYFESLYKISYGE